MSLAVTTMPNAVAPAAHSSMQGANKNSGPSSGTNTSQASQSAVTSSQAAAIVSFSSDDKSRTTSSRPNEKVDKNFSSEREKSDQKENSGKGRGKVNISA